MDFDEAIKTLIYHGFSLHKQAMTGVFMAVMRE
jgi:hypothetical protein